MTHDTMQQLLRKQPFQSFSVRLSNGDAYSVQHPECAALSKTTLLITDLTTDRVVTCSLLHIASVEPVEHSTSGSTN